MRTYPCKICIVRGCCTEYCDKIVRDEKVIALFLLMYNTCPDCGCEKLMVPLMNSDNLYDYGVASYPSVIICSDCRKVFTSDPQPIKGYYEYHIFSLEDVKYENRNKIPEFRRLFSIRGEKFHQSIEETIKMKLSKPEGEPPCVSDLLRPRITKNTKIWGQKPIQTAGLFVKNKNGKWRNILSDCDEASSACAIIK